MVALVAKVAVSNACLTKTVVICLHTHRAVFTLHLCLYGFSPALLEVDDLRERKYLSSYT